MAVARKFRVDQADTYHNLFFTSDGQRVARYPGPEALYNYELLAVINHESQIDNGYYTGFARS